MKKILLLLIVSSFWIASVSGQERYLDQKFSEYDVQTNVMYGVNATILLVPQFGQAIPQPLLMDIYTPKGDTETERPLILYFHTGNFLPHPQNGSVSGTIRDSTCVEICSRLAKMGYVVASVDYRLGWAPTNPSKDIRVFSLINAAYRGVQDANTCIRFFKRDFVEFGNRFGIDTSKITLWGQGTGGYVAANCSAIDAYGKIPSASNGKFLISTPVGILPMVIESINGDIYGTSVGVVPPGFGQLLGVPDGDTLCYPNHIGYSSEYHLGVNMGGAVGDSAWIDPGHAPIISMHATTDKNAPYKEGLVNVPIVPPLEVVIVQGSYIIQQLSNDFGNNAVFADPARLFNDPYTLAANKLNDGYEGLYPLVRENADDSAPWEFWSPSNPNHARGLLTNPDMSKEKALRFIDTLINYAAPRACLALNLGCNLSRYTGTNNLDPASVGLEIVPNPAQEVVQIKTFTDYPILSAQIMDINGRSFRSIDKINSNQLTINRSNLTSGLYVIKLRFENGEAFSKIVFK
jgi:hypothetical protein